MADPSDVRPFKQLLRLVVRAFYPGHCPPAHYQDGSEDRTRLAKIDTTGLAIVITDYLLDREWVGEEQIATDLGQHHKLLRRALKFLESEHLIMCHSQRETKRSQKRDMVRQAVDGLAQQLQEMQGVDAKVDDEEEGAPKHHTYSYWAVDFPRAFDMVQLRIHVMKKLLKDELDAKDVVARYMCKAVHCAKEYNSYDIMDIIQGDGSMVCAMCGGSVEQVLATGMTGDEEQRKARKERLSQLLNSFTPITPMLQRLSKLLKDIERQLEPITQLVQMLKQTQPPHHGSITDWARLQQARAQAGGPGGAAGGAGASESRGRVQGGIMQLTAAGGAARNKLYQETHVQVTLAPAAQPALPAAAAGAAGAAGLPAVVAPAGPVLGVAAGPKAPSLQPFFLKSQGAAAGAQAGAAAGQGQAGTSHQHQSAAAQQDDYTARMLALMGNQQAAAGGDNSSQEPPAKRAKVEEGGGEEEEWEDI